jgi:hypothetical protein
VVLLAASDTGASNSDRLTNLDNSAPGCALTFRVSGAIIGATITLYAGATAIGSATAIGAETDVTTDGATTLASGVYSITATQTASGKLASAASPAISVTIDIAAPSLLAAVSRKVHGSVGAFDQSLNLNPLANPTVEPRRNGPTQLLFTFNKAVAATDGALGANEFTLTNATYVSATLIASNLTLNLTNIVDQSRVTVVLNGLNDVAGNALTGTNAIRIRALYGDANQSGTVSLGDLQAVKNSMSQPLSAANFLCDLNLTGTITLGDMQAAKNASSHTVPLSGGSGGGLVVLGALSAAPITPATTLGEALGAPALAWSSNGDEVWSPTIAPDGSGAAWSGSIGNLSVSWVETTVMGPGTLTFQWKVSSELDGDFLTFSVDGVKQPGCISGEAGWQTLAFTIPTGAHRLTWTYAKNRALAVGFDAGWLRQVGYQRTP